MLSVSTGSASTVANEFVLRSHVSDAARLTEQADRDRSEPGCEEMVGAADRAAARTLEQARRCEARRRAMRRALDRYSAGERVTLDGSPRALFEPVGLQLTGLLEQEIARDTAL